MGIVRGVCIARERKSEAHPVQRCKVDLSGIEGDIHYGTRKSSVSMLPFETVKAYFDEREENLRFGRFGENLLIEGLKWEDLKVGMQLICGSVILEIERIGAGGAASDAYTGYKVCSPMEPYFVFCKAVKGGVLKQEMEVGYEMH